MSASVKNVREAEAILSIVRREGVLVRELDGWRERGRPASFHPIAVLDHHDASSLKSGEWGALGTILNGRPDVRGPLAQWQVARCLDDVPKLCLVAAGYCNHGGYGHAIAGIPRNSANTYSYGVEKANNGVGEPYRHAALFAAEVLLAAIAEVIGNSRPGQVVGHREYTDRKTDPTYSMDWMRGLVAERLKGEDVIPPDQFNAIIGRLDNLLSVRHKQPPGKPLPTEIILVDGREAQMHYFPLFETLLRDIDRKLDGQAVNADELARLVGEKLAPIVREALADVTGIDADVLADRVVSAVGHALVGG